MTGFSKLLLIVFLIINCWGFLPWMDWPTPDALLDESRALMRGDRAPQMRFCGGTF